LTVAEFRGASEQHLFLLRNEAQGNEARLLDAGDDWHPGFVGLGLALCLGDISPAHATSTAVERRIYSAVDTDAFYVAMSSPALIFSAATYVVAVRRRTRVVSNFVLGTTWPIAPLLLFLVSLCGQLLYLAV
jgi:hypothetical protein